MSVVTYVFGIVAAAVVLGIVLEMLRRRRVRERHAVWWIVAGILSLLVAVFPGILTGTAHALGFTVPTNLGFFVALVILFLVSVQQSAELTVLEEKTRTLDEHAALHDERIRRLESAVRERTANEDPSAEHSTVEQSTVDRSTDGPKGRSL